MKIKNGFICRQVGGNNVVVATGAQSKIFNGVIKLNESGLVLWNKLLVGVEKNELVDALLAEYDVDRTVVEADVDKFLKELRDAGAIEE